MQPENQHEQQGTVDISSVTVIRTTNKTIKQPDAWHTGGGKNQAKFKN
jgi:hypothetical protein